MSEQPISSESLEFDLGDRLRKSLRVSGISVQGMADYLEVSRNSVGRWLNGHGRPKRIYIRLWAYHVGVPVAWLETGDTTADGPPPGGGGPYDYFKLI